MIDKDRKQFFALIADVYAFYKQDFSDFAGNVWWQAMAPYELNAVNDALNRHCINPDSGQFMPKPADVVKMLQGSTQDAALVAWSKLDRAIRAVGPYRSVVFDDPLIHRIVVEMGGWVLFGTKNDEEWPFVRNEFVNRYRGYRMRNDVPEYLPVLIGIAEAQNSLHKLNHHEQPSLLGDPDKALKVMKSGCNKPLLAVTQIDKHVSENALRIVHSRGAA